MSLRSLAISAIVLASGLCLGSARAQGSFNALLAVPLGDFSSKNNANVGFGAGLEYNAPMSGGAGWVSGVGLTFNASDKSNVPSGIDAEGGNYLTLPLLTGMRFTGGANDGPVKFYVQGQAGIAFFLVTDEDLSRGSDNATVSTDNKVTFCFGGGVGLIIQDKVNLGIRFLGTPEMDMSGQLSSGGQSADLNGKLTVSMLQLNVGTVF